MLHNLKVNIGEINSTIVSENGNPVACTYSGYFGKEEGDKLAKLFAAAPELLTVAIATLEDILSDQISDNKETRQLAIDNLRSAISKATS